MLSLLQVGTNGTGLPPITVDALLGDVTVLLVLSAVIVGIAWRTLGKYWDKWRDGEVISFDRVFLGTAIGAFVGAVTPALALFPAASATFTTALGNYGLILAWIITAFSAYGINEGINYTYRRMEHKAEEKAVQNLRETIPELDKLITEKMEKVAEELKQGAQELKQEVSKPDTTAGEGRHET
jgi:hypothetical protein